MFAIAANSGISQISFLFQLPCASIFPQQRLLSGSMLQLAKYIVNAAAGLLSVSVLCCCTLGALYRVPRILKNQKNVSSLMPPDGLWRCCCVLVSSCLAFFVCSCLVCGVGVGVIGVSGGFLLVWRPVETIDAWIINKCWRCWCWRCYC